MAHARATAGSTLQAETTDDTAPELLETGARLTRLFSMGITILYPLVGIATTTRRAGVGDWIRLVALGVLFHVYADIANDVADLPIDSTDPRRARDPLVRRQVSTPWGLWIALTPLPLMALLLLHGPIRVGAALATGVGLLGIYNIAGKTIPIPFVADFTQGAGWAALVFVGAELGGRSTPTTWLAAGFVVVFVAMVNGVHGAVRDVENDRLAGAKTTAVILGARIWGAGLSLPRSLVTYAAVLQAALAGILIGILVANTERPGWSWRIAGFLTVVSLMMAISHIVMAFRNRTDLRAAMAAGTWHLVLTPVGLLMATVLALGPPLAVATAAVFVAPPLLYGRILRHVGRQLPSTTLGEPSRPVRDTHARRSGLGKMTRIGVPATGAMLVLVGAHLGGGAGLSVTAAMVATGLTVAASNVLNDRCDVVADRINDRRRPLVVGAVTENEADKFVLGLSCAAFAAAAFLGVDSLIVMGGMLTVGLAYSLFLRRVVAVAQLSISLLFTVPIFYGAMTAQGLRIEHWMAAALVAVFVFARETIKGYPDRSGDLAVGYATLATRYGKSGVLLVFRVTAGVLVLVALATTWIVGTIQYSLASLLCVIVPTLIIVQYLRGDPDAERIQEATARFGVLFALGLVPLFLMQ